MTTFVRLYSCDTGPSGNSQRCEREFRYRRPVSDFGDANKHDRDGKDSGQQRRWTHRDMSLYLRAGTAWGRASSCNEHAGWKTKQSLGRRGGPCRWVYNTAASCPSRPVLPISPAPMFLNRYVSPRGGSLRAIPGDFLPSLTSVYCSLLSAYGLVVVGHIRARERIQVLPC